MYSPAVYSQNEVKLFTLEVQCDICGRQFSRQAYLKKHTPACERKRDAQNARPVRLKLILNKRAENEDAEEPLPRRTPAEVQRYALKGFERAQAKLDNLSPLRIVDDRYRQGQMEYLVRWKEQKCPTWETVESLRYYGNGKMLVHAYDER